MILCPRSIEEFNPFREYENEDIRYIAEDDDDGYEEDDAE